VPATFFCIGERVAAHPALTRNMVAAGHAVENHSQRHLNHFSLLGPRGLRAEIERAQQIIAGTTGVSPRFFRAPAACAARCSTRFCSGWDCAWRAGRGGDSTRSITTPGGCWAR
ncbi:Polysaccharide deacetylase domain protein, partial [mine drainage metagenome]